MTLRLPGPAKFEINVNGSINSYYIAKDLIAYDETYFHGYGRTIRGIISIKNIPDDQVLYASLSKRKGWSLASNQEKPHSRATLLIRKEWVEKNVPNIMEISTKGNKKNKIIKQKSKSGSVSSTDMGSSTDAESNTEKEINTDIERNNNIGAPPLLILSDKEKFRDIDGNAFDIETRGNRNNKNKNIYFLVKDISKVFEIPNLRKTISDKRGTYLPKKHYETFICKNTGSTGPNTMRRRLFITYEGMIKVLFNNRSNKSRTFIKWATETLFIIQMGNDSQKEEIASGLIGIPANTLRQVLKTSAMSVPCVYQFALGTAKSLRTTMKLSNDIPDDFIITKYGFTDNLSRRTTEHMKNYGNIANVNLELVNYCYIDPKYLSQAEVLIKEFFVDIELPITYNKFAELVAINPKHKRQIKTTFKSAHDNFAGCVSDLMIRIEDLKRNLEAKIIEIKHINAIHKVENERKNEIIARKDEIIARKNVEIENEKLRREMAELRLAAVKK